MLLRSEEQKRFLHWNGPNIPVHAGKGGAVQVERGLLTSVLTRSLVEEFLAKYLKAAVAPDLDLVVRVDKK